MQEANKKRNSSANFLDNIRNQLFVKMKIEQSLEKIPDDYRTHFIDTKEDVATEMIRDSFDHENYNTEKSKSSNRLSLKTSDFIKNEKRKNHLAKKRVTFSTSKELLTTSTSETNHKTSSGSQSIDYYKRYSAELEDQIDILFKRNEELEAKLNDFTRMETDLLTLRLKEIKFNKFQKLLEKYEMYNLIKATEQCDNPVCVSNLLELSNLQVKYDKNNKEDYEY